MPSSPSTRTHRWLLLALLLVWMAPLLHRHAEHAVPPCGHGDAVHLEAAAAETPAPDCPACRGLGRLDAAPAPDSFPAAAAGVAPAPPLFPERLGAAPFLGAGGSRAPPVGG